MLTIEELQEVFDEMRIGKVVINMNDKPQEAQEQTEAEQKEQKK